MALSLNMTDFLRDSKCDKSHLILPMVGFRLRPDGHRRCILGVVELLWLATKARGFIRVGSRRDFAQNDTQGVSQKSTIGCDRAIEFNKASAQRFRRFGKR